MIELSLGLFMMLGPPPAGESLNRHFDAPASWPQDEADEVYLYRALETIVRAKSPADEGAAEELATQTRFALQRGELQALIVDRHRGCIAPLPAERWKGASGQALFWKAEGETSVSRAHWIDLVKGPVFLQRASLDRFVSPLAPVAAQGIPEHLSPYLRFMLRVADQLKITPDNQVNVESIRAHLTQHWPAEFGDLSRNLIDAMGTLLREPGSQRGRKKG